MRKTILILALSGLQVGVPLAVLASTSRPAEPGKSVPEVPGSLAPTQGREQRPVSVGFAGNARLHAAVSDRLKRDDRYQIIPSDRIPQDPIGVYVGGRLLQLQKDKGWVSCSAMYYVATQPTRVAQIAGTVKARVPMLAARSVAERLEVRTIAEDACLSEVAQQIKVQMGRIEG